MRSQLDELRQDENQRRLNLYGEEKSIVKMVSLDQLNSGEFLETSSN